MLAEQSDVVMAPPPGGVINQRHYSAFYKNSTFRVIDGRNPVTVWREYVAAIVYGQIRETCSELKLKQSLSCLQEYVPNLREYLLLEE